MTDDPRPSRNLRKQLGLGLLLVLGLLVTAWLLNVSRPGTSVEGCPEGCATVGERRSGPLRVLSLNVLHGFPQFEHLSQRLDLIAGEIRCQDADIVCLQEVPWTLRLGSGAQYLAAQTGLNHLYLRANGNRRAILFEEGEAILSRYPLREAGFLELEPQAGFFEHRVALWATAVTPWGDLQVLTTHLTHGDPEINHAQAAMLASFVAKAGDGPAVIAGDLNAVEDSPQIEMLTERWTDAFRAAAPVDSGPTCCIDDLTAGPTEPLEGRIDYLFLVPGQGASVVTAQRVLDRPHQIDQGWQWASDHVGLLIGIALD
jgi:endonuclease/exonuclease/phosphatase family metal-dependent hydrolase